MVVGNISESLVDLLSLTVLCQFNQKRNINNRTLDLLLSNVELDRLTPDDDDEAMSRIDRHHPPISLVLDVSPMRYTEENRPPKSNFFRAEYQHLSECVANINSVNVFECLGANQAVSEFYDLLSPLIETISKTRTVMRSFPWFYTRELVEILKMKTKARRKYLRTQSPADRTHFTDLRKEFKARKKLCEDVYISDVEDSIRSITKVFFSYTKSASHPTLNQIAPDFHMEPVSVDEVKAILDRLDQFKISSPDDVPSVFFKKLSSTISLPLSLLYNRVTCEGTFPSVWKIIVM